MLQFQCESCGIKFEGQGTTHEYNSPVYGPCSKKVADCPQCGETIDEYRPPKQAKSKSDFRPAAPAMGSCPAGGRCCANQG
ncbi:MAG: hypothetical protein EA408_02715 [Marinilabiliales bacterium]|nr:MAG: hypothetical protein EA408_02715 [Marinilabiliales bacterium]